MSGSEELGLKVAPVGLTRFEQVPTCAGDALPGVGVELFDGEFRQDEENVMQFARELTGGVPARRSLSGGQQLRMPQRYPTTEQVARLRAW